MQLELTDKNFHTYEGTVQQGAVQVSGQRIATLLGSCVCIGFYHAQHRLAGISHITGFQDTDAHSPEGALAALEKSFRKHGIRLEDCECFVVGGSERTRHVYDSSMEALDRHGLRYEVLDVLGNFHRKLMIHPENGRLVLYKKNHADKSINDVFKQSESKTRFEDRQMRIATGASSWFRNAELLALIPPILDDQWLKGRGHFHIWCAGCSIGLEAYSLAIAAIDHLDRTRNSTEFKILGSDISEDALEQARKGEYIVDRKHLGAYAATFDRLVNKTGKNSIAVGDRLRQTCFFQQRDIEHGSRKHKFELVVCDHVMQYYPEAEQLRYAAKLIEAIGQHGFLYLSTPSLNVRDLLPRQFPLKRVQGQLYQLD